MVLFSHIQTDAAITLIRIVCVCVFFWMINSNEDYFLFKFTLPLSFPLLTHLCYILQGCTVRAEILHGTTTKIYITLKNPDSRYRWAVPAFTTRSSCLPQHKRWLITFLLPSWYDQEHCTVCDSGKCTTWSIKNKAQHHKAVWMNDVVSIQSYHSHTINDYVFAIWKTHTYILYNINTDITRF